MRDTLLLAIPIRKIAPGAEDTEIIQSFGVPVEQNNIDPRWQALAALKDNTDLKDHAGSDGLLDNG